ncbi:MAG: GNAT family N-acetyltransferase [Pseudomonadota bacterium]
MTHTIKAATHAAEVAHVRALFEEYARSLSVDLDFQDFDAELASLPGDYTSPSGTLLLASDAAGALGCVAVRALGPGAVAELKRLYVRPRGRGTGLGRRLTDAALTFARAAGYAAIRLDTLPEMGDAQQLYAAFGFTEIDAYRYNPVAGTRYFEYRFRDGEQQT